MHRAAPEEDRRRGDGDLVFPLLAISWTPVRRGAGGAAIRAGSLLREMSRRGEVFLLSPDGAPAGLAGRELPATIRLPADVNPDVLSAFSPVVRRAVEQTAKALAPRTVLAFGLWSMPLARAAADRVARDGHPRPRIVFDAAHVESVSAGESRSPLDPRLFVLRRFERREIGQADLVWSVSAADGARLAAIAPSAPPAFVVPNGIDPCEASPLPTGFPFRALFLARMSWRPNREAAMRIARELAPRAPEIRFVIAGESPPRGLAGAGVEVVESPGDLEPLYAGAHAAIVPIRTGTGTRIKVLEAAMRGRPVVATPRALEGLPLDPGVDVLEAEDTVGLVGALESLRADPGLAGEFGTAARRKVLSAAGWGLSARAALASLESVIAGMRCV